MRSQMGTIESQNQILWKLATLGLATALSRTFALGGR